MKIDRRLRQRIVHLMTLTGIALAVARPLCATPVRIVTPNDGTWQADLRQSQGSAEITGELPRSGNGSLELQTTGLLSDWGWFNLFAGDPLTAGWGLLSDLDLLKFDWLRAADDYDPNNPVWQAQSVSFRIYVRSGPSSAPQFSELVWESIYNNYQPVPRDQWVVEDITSQLFWRFVTGEGYTLPDCSNTPTINSGFELKTEAPQAWGNGSNCMSNDAFVYGIGVGVGSNWPNPFHGFADNVQLGFLDQPLVVNDNFELTTVPEPAALWVIGLGLAGLTLVYRRGSQAGRA